MHEIDGAILSARSPFEIASGALDGLRKLLPAGAMEVVELEQNRQTARVLADLPCGTADSRRGETFPLYQLGHLDELAAGRAIGTSTGEGSAGTTHPPEPLFSRGSNAALIFPLLARNQLIGVLRVLPSSGQITDGRIEEAREVADHLAVALEHARLNEELAQRAQELERANTRLRRLDKAKSNLLTVASHELRTPLSIVMGYGELLEGHPAVKATPGLPQLAAGIRRGTERLNVILQDMFDVSSLELGKTKLMAVEVDMAAVVSSVVAELAAGAAERRLRLVVLDFEGLPRISGDPDALAKALRHLVLNGIKFTPDCGSITVRGRLLAEEGEASAIDVLVEDTGIGIDPGDHELIFETFFRLGETRLHSSGRTKFKGGGPGLGLAVARRVVEAHGGRIWVESRGHDEGACPGSRFVFRLPLVRPPDPESGAARVSP